jgi:UDP-galactopyranose mutase
MRSDQPLVVFSHLRWDFVYQRPQHLLSRLARRRPVFFIEEPMPDAGGTPRWDRSTPEQHVTVCRPMAIGGAGFGDESLPALQPLLDELVATERLRNPVAWLYTPMALPLARRLEPVSVIYDCMDELSLFKGAPPQLLERERELLAWADVVFTGGPSLYRSKQGRHHNIHCFSSSVDAAHFRQARTIGGRARAVEPADQEALPRPRLGFYGVLDERLDLSIVDAMARAHPEWQLVFVGPVVKIDPAELPRHPNVHYLGQRSYGDLPGYMAGWDVCLLPFARNDATRFISPTKTLEYMGAERPIVSTPITDVAEPYGDIVYLGETPAEFIAACEAALAETEIERARRVSRMRSVLANTSWDATVGAMETLLAHAIEGRPAARQA